MVKIYVKRVVLNFVFNVCFIREKGRDLTDSYDKGPQSTFNAWFTYVKRTLRFLLCITLYLVKDH